MNDHVLYITEDLAREDFVKTVSNRNSQITFRKSQELRNV